MPLASLFEARGMWAAACHDNNQSCGYITVWLGLVKKEIWLGLGTKNAKLKLNEKMINTIKT